jgi:hypothetical protein
VTKITHGTNYAYSGLKCRCDICRDGWAAYKRSRYVPKPRRTPQLCSIEGCASFVKARGLCQKHYHRLQRHGDPTGGSTERVYKSGRPCRVDGCLTPSRALGYCPKHEARFRKRDGDLSDPPAPRHRYKVRGGYIEVLVDGRRRPEHQVVVEEHIGRPLLPGENVHHRNGVRDDNRLSNLELWSKSQPPGQRAVDKLSWAREIVALYGPLEDAGLI